MSDRIINNIYIPTKLRDKWNSKGGKNAVLAFLEDGLEFVELFAVYRKEALDYLKSRPILHKLLSGEDANAN